MKIDKKYVLNTKAYSKMLKKNNEKIELYRKKIDKLEKQNKLYKDNSEAKCHNCKYRQSRFYTGGWDDVSSGILINVDVNGSLNIMRLGLEKQNVKLDVVEEILRQEHKKFMLNPMKICV